MNNPQDNLKCIHIAGTKGKGSTCAFIAYILRQAQFRVGLYTSPHLSDFRERIRLLIPSFNNRQLKEEFEGMIHREELTSLIERLKPYIDKYNSQSRYGALSFFEACTVLAFEYFKQKKVDFAVLETGLGGRLDATNVVNSLIAIITPISQEHTRQLGKSLAKIAAQKTGIIKIQKSKSQNQNLIVITAPQQKEVMEIIRDRCRQRGATLYEIGRDIIFRREEFRRGEQCFNIDGVFGRLADLKIRLSGRHQIINATLAVSAVLALHKFYQARLNLAAIKNGLYNTTWPGRFELVVQKPLVILDGAQNLASAQVLAQTLTENFSGKRIILVLGISQDKDIKGICQVLIPISEEIILTQADNSRAADVDTIEKIISSQSRVNGLQIFKVKSTDRALELARTKANDNDLILVTGSLFLVGEARESLLKNRDTLPISTEG